MVIYVLNARLECLTNFTIFRFRWFNNWFPYFWINWLGYGLTLGYLLFISIFFGFFRSAVFGRRKCVKSEGKREKHVRTGRMARRTWKSVPTKRANFDSPPLRRYTFALAALFTRSRGTFARSRRALSLSAAAFHVLPCDIYNVSLQLGYQFAASEELFLHCFFAGKLLWAPKTLFWFGILSCWAFPTVIC